MAAFSRKHQEENKAPWAAQVRYRALFAARSDRVAGGRAAPRPNEPEPCQTNPTSHTRPHEPSPRTNPSLAIARTNPTSHTRPHEPSPRTNPSRASNPNEPDAPLAAGLQTRARPNPSRAAKPNEPEPHTARPVRRVRALWRGHAFPRTHGPGERKVNGDWFMSVSAGRRIGRITNRAWKASHGLPQNSERARRVSASAPS
jgi:hypothetical protein